MMTKGKRESDWLVIRRCLAMIRRAQHGPASREELIEAVRTAEPEAYSQTTGSALHKRFHRDLGHIRDRLGVDLRADPRTGQYAIEALDRPLLELSPEALQALAWLEQTFGPGTPHEQAVQALLRQLRFYLPARRRAEIARQRTAYVLKLGQQDDDALDPQVELKLQEALARRLQVEFDYTPNRPKSDPPARHVVDVFEPPRFEPSLGHYYLYGWCHMIVRSESRTSPDHYITYRLGRIRNVRPTGQKLPPSPPPAKKYQVQYHLSATVARHGVTRRRWIDIDSIHTQPDDSAIVTGTSDNLFFALQELMHYRQHCRILGGPELLHKMRETVEKMAQNYQLNN